jgi:PAS domain S-box-containing protein
MVESIQSSDRIVSSAVLERPIRVLHVDDDPAFLKVAKQCLEMQGKFEVDTASSVNEALEKLEKTDYDAVVSDYQMPGKDGLEFLKELREKGNTVPFIVFTGKGREAIAIKALNLGADRYIDKHGDPETVYCELEHAIRRTVEQTKAERALETCGERYERLFKSAVEGILINGSDGRISSLNPAAANILGYNSPKELIGKPAVELYADPDSRARLLQELMEIGHVKECELTWKRKDGTLVEILASVTVQKDEKSNLLRTEEIIRDVSERKRSERLLRESEEKYRKLFGEALDAIFVADAETGILLDCNRAASELVGRDKSELVGKHQRILYPPEKTEGEFSRTFKQHLKEKEGQILETQVITKKREIKDVAVKANVFELGNKRVVQGIFRDTTGLVRMSSFPERNPNPILEVDLDGNTNYLNPAAQKLLSHLRGLKLLDTFEKEIKKLVDEFKTHRKEKFVRGNVKIGDRYYQQSIYYFSAKTVLRLYMTDITERKQAEGELLKSETKYRTLLENLPQKIFFKDKNSVYMSCNENYARDLKIHSGEIEGKTDYDFYPKQLAEKYEADDKRIMKSGKTEEIEEDYIQDGKSAFVHTVKTPVKDENGRVVGALGIFWDITERKEVEEQPRDSEKKYRELFETSIDAIATSDMDGHFLDCNRSCQKMLGYSLDEMKKLTYQQLTPEKWREKEAEIIEKEAMKKGYTAEYEKELIRKDGAIISVSNRTWVTFDDDEKPKAMWGIVRDITERKKTEKMLQESEERFRAIFEGANDGILAVDVKTRRFAFANPRICEIAGYSLEELLKLGVSDIVPKKDLSYVIDSFTKQMQGKLTLSKGMPVLRKDERVVYCDVSSKPIKIGSQEYLIGIFRDVTERRKAQEDLRNSEERLSIMFELAPDAYYLNDLKGNFLDGNKAAEELTGYARNELVGKSFLKLKLLPRSQALKAAKLLTMNALGKPTGPDEFVLNNKDGIQVPVEIRTYPVRIKDKTVVLGIARDITTRKKDEQVLKESQQKFEGLFRHNPEAAVYLDLDSKVLDVNPRFCELFGYSAKEVEGKQINEVVVPEDMIEEAEKLDKDAKKGYASHDTVRKRKDGSLVHVSISASPVTVEGRLLGYVGVYKDITELKNAGVPEKNERETRGYK